MLRLLFVLITFSLTTTVSAQKKKYFSKPVEGFSKKKTSYITTMDGEELVGTIKKLKRKKWLFEEVQLIVENGDKVKLKADQIKHMYLPQSGLDKFADIYEWNDATQWDKVDVNAEHIKNGYSYFESTDVYYKKRKKKILLLQLLNPSFSNMVKVFHDPGAKESAGLGIGGIKVAGGGDKSYYVKVGDEVAYKLKKKNYDDKAESLYAKCADYFKSNKKEMKWKKFGEHLMDYSSSCN